MHVIVHSNIATYRIGGSRVVWDISKIDSLTQLAGLISEQFQRERP